MEVKQGHEGCRDGFCGKGSHCCRASSSSFRNFPLLLPEMVGFGGNFTGIFSLFPRAGLTLSQGKTFPRGGIQRAARSQPRTGAEFRRRIWFSSSILPWGAKGGPAPAAVRAGALAGSFMPVKYYPGAGEILEAWDQGQGVLSPHIPPSHPMNFPACSLLPGMLNLRCKFPGKIKILAL